ncbi:hypothetical protein SGFS_075310 [Streptomyces graminofaciens]|uniref:Uncharacterized protein n=1 Tax=Streptomyces graminofaciens TaxID=68212 RepID=A0ABN5VRX1_9ACTN|nr:hypothetical protein [Streptomyces graminofaciens]BBC36237.1 hypothetical protein SGFS_075310 [Streptomyces graminofaciens]
MSKITFEELDGLTGEMLPERSVLSTFAPVHGGGNDGAVVTNACVSHHSDTDKGLLNLGLTGNGGAQSSITCAPGNAVAF